MMQTYVETSMCIMHAVKTDKCWKLKPTWMFTYLNVVYGLWIAWERESRPINVHSDKNCLQNVTAVTLG